MTESLWVRGGEDEDGASACPPAPCPGFPGTLLPAPLLSRALLMKEGWGLRCCFP